jgi:hypothetical protein
MYATIWHRERGMASTNDLALAGHALGLRLGAAPGFITCLLVETTDGGYAAIGVFDDPASLAAADELIAAWSPAEFPAPWATPARRLTGEIVAQKGL